jgi:uncharacterized Zn-binding protein involved in type VI secretion
MPAVARRGDTVNTGHGCDTTTTIVEGSSNVFIGGAGATYQGAALAEHTLPNPAVPPIPPCISHPGQKVNAGSATVKVNGKPLARKTDSADLGSISSGATTVFAN